MLLFKATYKVENIINKRCAFTILKVNEYQLARCILSVIKTEKHRYFYGDYLLVILWYFPVNLKNNFIFSQ